MKTCDDYQLELEMRRHGALDPEATAALEVHLLGCERCRRAEALAQSTEAAMHEATAAAVRGVSWEKVKRNIEKDQRLLKLLPGLMLASFVSQGAIFSWLLAPERWLRGTAILTGLGVVFALGTWLTLRGRIAKSDSAQRLGADGLLQHRRQELDVKLKELRGARWALLLGSIPVMAIPVIKGATAGAFGAFAAIGVCCIGTAAYYHFVALPKTRRERDELR